MRRGYFTYGCQKESLCPHARPMPEMTREEFEASGFTVRPSWSQGFSTSASVDWADYVNQPSLDVDIEALQAQIRSLYPTKLILKRWKALQIDRQYSRKCYPKWRR